MKKNKFAHSPFWQDCPVHCGSFQKKSGVGEVTWGSMPASASLWVATGKSLNLSELQFSPHKIRILKAALLISHVTEALKEGRNKHML